MNIVERTEFFLERMRAEPVLCLVTDRGYFKGPRFVELVAEAVEAGVNMVHLRDKDGQVPLRQSLEEGRILRELCARRRIPFIVNDQLDLAMALDADGVHLGQGDLPLQTARRLWGEGRLYGLSVSTVDHARADDAALASYLGAGAVFETGTKRDAMVSGEGELARIAAAAGVEKPVIALGGIDATRARRAFDTGCRGVAVVSAVWGAASPSDAVRRILEAMEGDVR